MVTFENFNELQMDDEKLAEELLNAYGAGDWQNEEIYYYEDLEDFAEYELYEGWYTGWFDTEKYKPSYFNGAPNPFDYIDLKELGEDLADCWDESCHYRASTDEVLTINYVW
ncbi:hypothetical protein AB9M75_04200 [Lactobacillus sp. AN1001]